MTLSFDFVHNDFQGEEAVGGLANIGWRNIPEAAHAHSPIGPIKFHEHCCFRRTELECRIPKQYESKHPQDYQCQNSWQLGLCC